MSISIKLRKGYCFGYGADQEEEMIFAITGHHPTIVSKATLRDYELRIQKLDEITTKHGNPRELLQKTWGNDFKSYVIVPKPGATVEGFLFKMSVKDRHLIDKWELVQMGWYERKFVRVQRKDTGKIVKAETQILSSGQSASSPAKKRYRSWLMPKKKLLKIANSSRHFD